MTKSFRVRWIAYPLLALSALSFLVYLFLKFAMVNTGISLKYEESSYDQLTQSMNRLVQLSNLAFMVLKASTLVLAGLLFYRWVISPSKAP